MGFSFLLLRYHRTRIGRYLTVQYVPVLFISLCIIHTGTVCTVPTFGITTYAVIQLSVRACASNKNKKNSTFFLFIHQKI